jgi:two-component sensor histidine kinase
MDNVSDSKEALKNLPKENIHLLLETIEGINRTMEFKSILVESMEAIRIIMNSEASSLMLQDDDTDELIIYMPTGPVKDQIKGKSIPHKKGIGGWVLENMKPYLTNDPENSEIFWGDLTKAFTTRNIICVPLINKQNKAIGVVQALNRRKNAEFNAQDIPVMQALASHITVAVERARQVDRLQTRLRKQENILTSIHLQVKNHLESMMEVVEEELANIEHEQIESVHDRIRGRLRNLSEMYELLSTNSVVKETNLYDYLNQVTPKITETIQILVSDFKIDLTGEKVAISSDKALFTGIILNELLIDIYRNIDIDIESESEITVQVDIKKTDDKVQVAITDKASTLSSHFSVDKKQSMGMLIVSDMLDRIAGKIIRNSSDKVDFTIEFATD